MSIGQDRQPCEPSQEEIPELSVDELDLSQGVGEAGYRVQV